MPARSTRKAVQGSSHAPGSPVEAPVASIALQGTPRSITGQIALKNAGSQRQLLRTAVLRIADRDPIAVPIAVALRPGTATVAPLRIDLGPSWPPGEVRGELEVGDTRVSVSLVVEPSISVDLSPTEVLATEGRTQVELAVENAGNVAIPLAVITRGRLVAHDEGAAVEPSAVPEPTPTRGRSAVPAKDGADVQCQLDESVRLEPGETRRLTVQLEVPAGLDPSRRYRATIPVGPADLTVTVLASDPRPGSGTTT